MNQVADAYRHDRLVVTIGGECALWHRQWISLGDGSGAQLQPAASTISIARF
jgi:hypothetical protein